MTRFCHCQRCPYCRSFEREESRICARDNVMMRQHRKREPLVCATAQSTLGRGRSVPMTHPQGRWFGPGGEA